MKKWFLFFIFFAASVFADRGMIPITRPDVSIYEPGQKAIIGWNGETEIMILAVDAYADTECKVLEILPLPTEPAIDSGSFKSFEDVQKLIMEHAPRMMPAYKGRAETLQPPGVELLFHKKIGPHNITCVKALDYNEFVDWALDFIKKQGIDTIPFPDELSHIMWEYMRNNIHYFVFDVVELSKETKSIVPLVYKFQSPYLYFPLNISRLAKGVTNIQLFLLTRYIPWAPSLEPFRIGKYTMYGTRRGMTRSELPDIIFEVDRTELKTIHPLFPKLLRGTVYLTALEFEGPVEELTVDLRLRKFCTLIEY